MKEFETESGLIFREIDFTNSDFCKENSAQTNKVNTWRSKEINEFVVDTREFGPLGDFFKDYQGLTFPNCFSGNAFYLVFDEKEVVASTLLSFNSVLSSSDFFTSVVLGKPPEDFSTPSLIPYNNCKIEYFVTNPKNLRKGYGTRAVSDICNSMEIISSEPLNLVITEINKRNKASIGLFEKVGFQQVSSGSQHSFDFYFKFLENNKEFG